MINYVRIPVILNTHGEEIDLDAPGGETPGRADEEGGVVGIGFEVKRHAVFAEKATDTALSGLRPFIQTVSGLFGPGEVESGAEIALDAVTDFRLAPSFWRTPFQFLTTRVSWLDRIALTRQTDVVKAFDGMSVTLGLALGLLMAGSASPIADVIATGELRNGKTPKGKPKGSGVIVTPIGGLLNKFRMVEAWAQIHLQNSARKSGEQTLFFTPLQNNDGAEVSEDDFKTAFMTGKDCWAARLDKVGVKIIPVKTLAEAVEHLKIGRAAPVVWDRVAQVSFVAAVVGLVAWGAVEARQWRFDQWRNQPITGGLAFTPYGDTSGAAINTPFRSDEIKREDSPLCRNASLVAGEWLNVNVRLGDGSVAEGYWPSVLAVPQFVTEKKTFKAGGCGEKACAAGPIPSGGGWYKRIETWRNEFEDMAVIVVADRHKDITSDLERNMADIIATENAANNNARVELDLRAVINRFEKLYSGRTLSTIVRIVQPKDCIP